MLQVKPVTFGYLAIDSLLNPDELVHKFVSPVLDQFARQAILGVNCPDTKEPLGLQTGHWNLRNYLIREGVVLYSYTSRGVGRRKFPWRVHHDDIE